jgi:hypothetical protein
VLTWSTEGEEQEVEVDRRQQSVDDAQHADSPHTRLLLSSNQLVNLVSRLGTRRNLLSINIPAACSTSTRRVSFSRLFVAPTVQLYCVWFGTNHTKYKKLVSPLSPNSLFK